MTGTRVLHYAIGEPLGSGGMGTVYRAEDTRLGRQVALKFLRESDVADAERRERLLREARAAAALRSPHVAAVFDVVDQGHLAFIVMELVDGEPLSTRLGRGPVAVRESVELALQVADALDEAHRLGIVHRDVKSANVMVDARGRAKLLDFGLAKFLDPPDPGEAVTRTQQFSTVQGTVLGTFSYMSPEQALGRRTDARTDLFSLGVVLYEMLTGRLPFEGDTAAEVLDRLAHAEPPPVSRYNHSVPPALETVVVKALAKSPSFRYQSARDLYVDLHGIGRSLDLVASASVAGAGLPVADSVRGARVPGAAGTAAPRRALAVMTFSNITREPADDWIGSGIAETVSADLSRLDGTTVIGRARIFDALRNAGAEAAGQWDSGLAIEVGRRVGASQVILGGYQRLGPHVRITAECVDVADGAVHHTVKVDGELADIFALQDRIVYELGRAMQVRLDESAIRGIARDETRSVEAYEAYSRGMMNVRMATREAIDRAIGQFERAVSLDPEYAEAWSGLGNALALKGEFLTMPELVLRGVEALRRATALNPQLASPYHRLASAYIVLGRPDAAVDAARDALRLEPGSAAAHATLGRAYWFGKGQFADGIAELEEAARLNPEGGYAFLQLALLYALQGDFDRAELAAARAVDLQEQFLSGTEGLQILGAHARLGYVRYRQGRYAEAIRHYERELVFLSTSDHALRERTLIEVQQKIGAAYLRDGNREEAERNFGRALTLFRERLARGAEEGATKYYVAALYALRGDAAHAVRYLRESLAESRALNVARARADPDFDAVRAEESFRELIDG